MTCMVSSKNVETSRDLKGNENDSDEQIPEDMSCNEETWEETLQNQDIWHADVYRNNLILSY